MEKGRAGISVQAEYRMRRLNYLHAFVQTDTMMTTGARQLQHVQVDLVVVKGEE